MLMHPGPGVDGPGPGVMSFSPAGAGVPIAVSQVRFAGPAGMHVSWQIAPPGIFSEEPLVAPANMDFPQGAIYRLKLTHVPGRDGDTFYPTLEIGPATPRTEAFLAHSKIPVQFTEADFGQVIAGNYVTKVIYLPDPEHQELAVAGGIEELVSTRLDPGIDPIVEADRKGTILAIIRMGNKDLETRGGAPRPRIKAMGGMQEEEVPVGPPVPEIGQPSTTPSFISGVTTVPYGMPYTGTPIGLPGPPHLPLGVPAGLKMHAITNHTEHRIPRPIQDMQIHVKQTPGLSYPQPPNTMYLHERVIPGGPPAATYPPYGLGHPPYGPGRDSHGPGSEKNRP
jgi:hypothetical protein